MIVPNVRNVMLFSATLTVAFMFDSQWLRTDYTVTANCMQDMAKDLGTSKRGVSLCKKEKVNMKFAINSFARKFSF